MDRNIQAVQHGLPVSVLDAAHANEYFEQFVNATSLKNILGYYRGLIDCLHLRPNVFNLFYPKLKANLVSWRAKALLKKFDARASHKCYQKGKLAANTKVLVIGGGPCGMRTAIEAQLLGAKVVVVEKRDRFSRNNVLHLWPFVIEDLRMLGAKKFFGKFCAGAIDHVSIRQLQCILLKVALLLGVEVHTEVSFEALIEPNATDKIGWRAEFKPANHPVSQYEFDVVIGADGKRNTLQGFTRKEFRGKLAIAITANFINRKTEAEARVEEISGVAFIFNQKFFKDLQAATRIDLENIVYYKDDTHYFVMTAKKHSLIEKGVIKQDYADTEKLLAPENVDKEALQQYAIEAASFSTNYQLPNLEFAVNHYGQPDIAMFDFTSMYAAENASKVVERNGYKLLKILVGDSLLEPFWPTGSGCARGFLSSLDAAWAIRSWALGNYSPLEVMAERESIYRLLAQTTPDNLNKDWKSYTLDPSTRYPNLNKGVVLPNQVICLYDTDNPAGIDKMKRASSDKPAEIPKKRRRGIVDNEVLLNWLTEQLKDTEDVNTNDLETIFRDGKVLCAIIHHYRPDLIDFGGIANNDPAKNNQIAIDVLEKELGVPPVMTGAELTVTEDYLTMASYLTEVYDCFRGEIPHVKHPKLELPVETNKKSELSFKTIKTSIAPVTILPNRPSSRHKHKHADQPTQKANSIDRKPRKRRTLEKVGANVDHENKPSQLSSRSGGKDEDIAAKIKNLESKWRQPQPVEKKPKDLLRAIGKIETSDWNIKEIEKKIMENKMGKPSKAIDKEKVPKWSKEQFLARQTKMEKKHLDRQNSEEAKFADIDRSIRNLDQKLKEGTVRELGQKKVATIAEKLVKNIPAESKPPERTNRQLILPTQNASQFCHFCNKRVYLMERLSAEGKFFHHGCFKCQYCHVQLRLGSYTFDRDGLYGYRFFCLQHFGMMGEIPTARVTRKPSTKRTERSSPDKKSLSGIAGVDLLDKVQTPERIEFSNLSSGHVSSDQEDSLNQIDEDEWTDKNFGASCAELDDTEDDSSSISDTDSDDEAYDDALEQPPTKEGTLRWAERWKNSYRRRRHSESDEYSSSDQSSYYDSSDGDESETATEGEEEIRARELRKKEVCVEPPIVHTDTGTDTEVKSSFNYLNYPDIVSDRDLNTAADKISSSRSSDNVSANSGEYNSAESGDLDLNMNKINDPNVVVGKLKIPNPSNTLQNNNPLAKSSTSVDVLTPKKVLRNFVIPSKDKKSFGPDFVPKFQNTEPQPLLIIKRTPSKISLPKEVGKPKVAVNTNKLDKEKYFGISNLPPKPTPSKPLIKQHSLPETSEEIKEVKNFNFEPEDEDMKDIDNYIENLIANEDELKKPIDPNKFKINLEPEEQEEEEESEKVSSSIEDLLKALESETKDKECEEATDKESEEKIDDLLNWMEGLEHDTPDRKVCRSLSEVKYNNLERCLKTPHLSDKIISKIPKNSLSLFESQVLGKVLHKQSSTDEDNKKCFGLKRSKTEIRFKRNVVNRNSVDLDAVEKVDIKKMLRKFETAPEEPKRNVSIREKPKNNPAENFLRKTAQRSSKVDKEIEKLNFEPKPEGIKNTIKIFENNPETKPKKIVDTKRASNYSFDDLEKFVQDTFLSIGDKYEDWGARVSVTSTVYPQYDKLDKESIDNDPNVVWNKSELNEKHSDINSNNPLNVLDNELATLQNIARSHNSTEPEKRRKITNNKEIESENNKNDPNIINDCTTSSSNDKIDDINDKSEEKDYIRNNTGPGTNSECSESNNSSTKAVLYGNYLNINETNRNIEPDNSKLKKYPNKNDINETTISCSTKLSTSDNIDDRSDENEEKNCIMNDSRPGTSLECFQSENSGTNEKIKTELHEIDPNVPKSNVFIQNFERDNSKLHNSPPKHYLEETGISDSTKLSSSDNIDDRSDENKEKDHITNISRPGTSLENKNSSTNEEVKVVPKKNSLNIPKTNQNIEPDNSKLNKYDIKETTISGSTKLSSCDKIDDINEEKIFKNNNSRPGTSFETNNDGTSEEITAVPNENALDIPKTNYFIQRVEKNNLKMDKPPRKYDFEESTISGGTKLSSSNETNDINRENRDKIYKNNNSRPGTSFETNNDGTSEEITAVPNENALDIPKTNYFIQRVEKNNLKMDTPPRKYDFEDSAISGSTKLGSNDEINDINEENREKIYKNNNSRPGTSFETNKDGTSEEITAVPNENALDIPKMNYFIQNVEKNNLKMDTPPRKYDFEDSAISGGTKLGSNDEINDINEEIKGMPNKNAVNISKNKLVMENLDTGNSELTQEDGLKVQEDATTNNWLPKESAGVDKTKNTIPNETIVDCCQLNDDDDDEESISISLSIGEIGASTFAKAVESTDTSCADEPTDSAIVNKRLNFDDLYAKIDKRKKDDPVPPQRPVRQKSRTEDNSNVPPSVPQRRKKSVTSSPLPIRKADDKSGVKKEVVTSYALPKPQKVSLPSGSPDSNSSASNRRSKKDSDSENCCIQ
ncbi:F-actin-monooxygenase Mical isoform X2 [Diorhabda sublineata]|uniref:F-actin-monooxygenase Mical isoform X2 n=1 Tax=Diorhabda sublineata TaxID=1163346 RepID=UPI0024E04302|nr:F-actin-monooxygenase Mical isoform X2 [Diorhabda sublineata]XP_056640534.1 F-actin-monooxygenase Mical isoform X2 [Diorhabda sublineata]